MVDSYDHLVADWENALRPAKVKPGLSSETSKPVKAELSLPPATSVFENRSMTVSKGRCVEEQEVH